MTMTYRQSLENSMDESIAPPRRDMLPSYGFRFKCDERAEKRKEFYSKLKERMREKEAERIALLEKSKDIQEAEIKMHRKTLIFKANPMPRFYYEPSPSKLELKKILPTRPRSPKFCCRRRSVEANTEETSIYISPLISCTSQDKMTNKMGINKGSSLFLFKKPIYKFHSRQSTEHSRFASEKGYSSPSVHKSYHLDVGRNKDLRTEF